MLSATTLDLIDQTVPALEQHGEQITRRFYQIMLTEYPEVRPFFNAAHQREGTQAQALANSVLAYGRNIRRLQALEGAVERIVHKHVAVQVQPEHYPIVGTCLLQAIREVLGVAATDAVLGAWEQAYQQLADLLIAREDALYQAQAQQPGGWRGERRFEVCAKVRESDVITSFHLKPTDGGGLPQFQPGQYVTVIAAANGERMRRQYSLSDAPGQAHLRISVKRETGGAMSNHLHDHIMPGDSLALLPPAGDFRLVEHHRPLVLLTGGVGITPAMSMLNASVHSAREIIFIHAALNSRHHAFRRDVEALALRHSNLKPHFLYNQPLPEDRGYTRGVINGELLARWLPVDADVDLYFLGPRPFMQSVWQLATELGIPAAQIRYEFFGPLQSLTTTQKEAAA